MCFNGWMEKSYDEVEKKFCLDISCRFYDKFFDFVDMCNRWKYIGSVYENYVHEIYIYHRINEKKYDKPLLFCTFLQEYLFEEDDLIRHFIYMW